MNVTIPDKQYYKIGEVAQLVGVRTSVLRFWEAEFDFLKPKKSSTGQRLYEKKEVSQIQEVKRLLYDEKYTLEGVKKRITRGRLPIEVTIQQRNDVDHRDLLNQIKSELLALRCQL